MEGSFLFDVIPPALRAALAAEGMASVDLVSEVLHHAFDTEGLLQPEAMDMQDLALTISNTLIAALNPLAQRLMATMQPYERAEVMAWLSNPTPIASAMIELMDTLLSESDQARAFAESAIQIASSVPEVAEMLELEGGFLPPPAEVLAELRHLRDGGSSATFRQPPEERERERQRQHQLADAVAADALATATNALVADAPSRAQPPQRRSARLGLRRRSCPLLVLDDDCTNLVLQILSPDAHAALECASREWRAAVLSLLSACGTYRLSLGMSQCHVLQELLPKAIAMLSDEVPCALYFDLDAFEATLRDVKQSFPPDTMHAIAMKANPLAACLLIAKELGFGCEVASPAELEHAMRLGFTPDRIVMDSPAKTRRDLRAALAAGVLLNADNLAELVRIDEILASEYGGGGTLGLGTCRSRIGIRVNPQLGEGSIAATGTIAPMSKFGVPLTEAKAELLQSFRTFRWLTGVHCHVGSQGCGLELLVSGARAALALADEINAAAGRPQVTLVDVGGGLPADYASDEPNELMPTRLTPGRYAAALRAQLPGLLGGGRYTVVTEFGRYASAKCALTISKVEYVKRAGGRRIATVHCGADLFLRTAYQPANWPHRVSAWDADGNFLEPAADGDVWDVVGPLCFRGDIVAQGVRLTSRLQSGHFVCVHDTGAYTLAMFSKYNSRQAPPAYGVRNGGRTVYQIASGETVDDALRLWQLPLSHPQAAAAGCERRAG
eukprot:jgi/Chrpa1/13392/Chrysochromulina_OHIO_Genome00004759-RA